MGCSSKEIKRFAGYNTFSYEFKEHLGQDVAKVTFVAPKLKEVLWQEDFIFVRFYDRCANSARKDDGYIGEIRLSSDTSIGKARTVGLDPKRPVFIEMGYMGPVQCANKFSLTPELGAKYTFSYTYNMGTCVTEVAKITDSGEVIPNELERLRNKDGLLSGSGSTDPYWRLCSTLQSGRDREL